MTSRTEFSGPALFSYGFRPFFLCAILFALLVVPLWLFVLRGAISIEGPFHPVDWHVHEMIFGYGAAVLAGFLFTAVPNWTGRMPTRGWPLFALVVTWILGRLAVGGVLGLSAFWVLLADQAFLLAVVAMIAREITAGRNWRNLKVLVPVTVLWGANVVFHAEAMIEGSADLGRRMGIAVLIFLIMLIGGRIIPSFTRNWLVREGAPTLPSPFTRFDAICIVAGAAALGLWVALPFGTVTGLSLGLAGLLHLARLARWRGLATWKSPLLIMLHAAYLLVPLGLIASGAGSLSMIRPDIGAHVLGIGAIGGMTVAVMMRATMGHTGRDLVAGPVLTFAFVMIVAATVARAIGWIRISGELDGVTLSAVCWTIAFTILAWRVVPWLAAPKAGRSVPGRPSRAT